MVKFACLLALALALVGGVAPYSTFTAKPAHADCTGAGC